MKQKTVRFYEEVPADISALQALNDCKKYGFNTAREMIVTAINNYVQGSDPHSLTLEEKDIDLLADRIAIRIGKTTRNDDTGLTEEIKHENSKDNETYQKALSFMASL